MNAVETDTPATATREDGLRVLVTGPRGDVATDMARSAGGHETAPTPGWLMRAALASCDATLVSTEAARAGIELTELEVTVESDSDSRGTLGLDDTIPPGPLEVRVHIRLAAEGASEDELRALAERAGARSPVGDALARAVPLRTTVVVA